MATTSGSPPVLSISLSDHSFSALASSFACTLAHSRPLWRFMFFSKRAFNVLILFCFFFFFFFRSPPFFFFLCFFFFFYQSPFSTPFGVPPSVHPPSPSPGE